MDKIRPNMFISSRQGEQPPVPEMPKIRKSDPLDVISFKGKVYVIHPARLQYLADQPEVLQARIEKACEYGMGFMEPNGTYGCMYCNHSPVNVATIFEEHKRIIAAGLPPTIIAANVSDSGCNYEEQNVRWATSFVFKNGTIVRARQKPCCVDEATIEVLSEKCLLEPFKEEINFDIPTLDEIITDHSLKQQHTLYQPGVIYRAWRKIAGTIGNIF